VFDGFHDRVGPSLGKAIVSADSPRGEIDVTSVLNSEAFGGTVSKRLAAMASCGFLIRKAEMANYRKHYGMWPTANARLWIKGPKLVVTLKPVSKPVKTEPPAIIDVRALAEKLKAAGGDGTPTSRVPENLAEMLRRHRAKPADVPDWMWRRVQEIHRIRGRWDDNRTGYNRLSDLATADREKYLTDVQWLLARPPGWEMGHSNIDPVITYINCGNLLPDVVRHHLRQVMLARWIPPYRYEWRIHEKGYFGEMATLNHQCQWRVEALLAGEQLGLTDLVVHAQRNLSLMNRQMIFVAGVNQEHGDTFYQSISLTTLKAAAKYSVAPLVRLKAGLGVEKMVFENMAAYHPGLKRRISPISRRYWLNALLLSQDVPRAVLHTLSKKGVMIEMDKLYLHGDPEMIAQVEAGKRFHKQEEVDKLGIPVFRFTATTPHRVSQLAPWGDPWEANHVDNKPIPFRFVGAQHCRLPPPEGDRGAELLQSEARKGLHGGPKEYEAPLAQFFRPGVDVRRARRDSARALIITGLQKSPTVILNGKPLSGPFQTFTLAGRTAYRVPIVREPYRLSLGHPG